MKFLALAACLIPAAFGSAIPRQAPASFYLKTVNSSIPTHNDLYAVPSHTGAGMNDLVLSSKPVVTASLNGSSLLFDLPGGPWSTTLNDEKYYACESIVHCRRGGEVIYLLYADVDSLFLSAWEDISVNLVSTVGNGPFIVQGDQLVANQTTSNFEKWLGK